MIWKDTWAIYDTQWEAKNNLLKSILVERKPQVTHILGVSFPKWIYWHIKN